MQYVEFISVILDTLYFVLKCDPSFCSYCSKSWGFYDETHPFEQLAPGRVNVKSVRTDSQYILIIILFIYLSFTTH